MLYVGKMTEHYISFVIDVLINQEQGIYSYIFKLLTNEY